MTAGSYSSVCVGVGVGVGVGVVPGQAEMQLKPFAFFFRSVSQAESVI